ncbi:hypothetical protein V7O67_09415 [Methanolobus sp. ZRKC4]
MLDWKDLESNPDVTVDVSNTAVSIVPYRNHDTCKAKVIFSNLVL